jgi:ribonuclease E
VPAVPVPPAGEPASVARAGAAQSDAAQSGPDAPAADSAGASSTGDAAAGTGRRRPARSRATSAAKTDAGKTDAGKTDAGNAGAAGSGRGEAGRSATPATEAAGQEDQPTGAPARAAAAAPFQPPLVIFQPPDISSARAPVARPQREQPAAAPGPAPDDEAEDGEGRDDGTPGSASRRRRRGGRGRGKATGGGGENAEVGSAAAVGERAGPDDDADDALEPDDDGTAETSATGKRRRRRRRTGPGTDGEPAATGADDPPNTVVHVRPTREKSPADVSDVRAVKGSTRLEAKRQRRREGRETGRRRPPIITESEFLARREAVERVMVVRQHDDRTQIAVMEDGVLVEHYVDKASHQSYVGNVYLGKVQNVLPSMEAAFVDIGKGRNAVLYAGEVNFDASGLEGESKRIESALKSGQSILVQVTKDPIGHKGARLTSQVSLPGRYLVYVPGASMTGISRKLPDTERSRLKQILKQVMPEHAGVIVRTAAEGASEEELARDVARLAAQWEAIEKKAKTASAPDLLYSEPDLTLRVVRDIFNEDFNNLMIASDSEWDLVDEYIRYVAPHLSDRMQRWDDAKDVFAAYRIDEQLAKALERKVWLPSGGSLVIDHTEAMTVIDVNTGKFTGQGGNLEQTVTRNNLEAAEEIVRQLRLRDLGGIIVIDFIDMVLESNRELVLRRLLECLARDRTKHQVAEVTSLGLVQMTRKRVGSGLLEAFSVPCEHCNGRGVIISVEPVDHSHSRDQGRNSGTHKDDNSYRNAPARDGSGQDGGGRGGQGGRGRGGSARRDSSSSVSDEAEAGTDGVAPSPATIAPGGSRSRSSRSRSGRPGGAERVDASGADPGRAGADGAGADGAGADGAVPGAAGSAVSEPAMTAAAVTAVARGESADAGTGATGAGLPEPEAEAAGSDAQPAASRPARSRSSRSRRSGPAVQEGADSEAAGSGQDVEPAGS